MRERRILQMKRKPKKHGLVQRSFAAFGCILLLVTSISSIFFGFTWIMILLFILALGSITGPALTEGAGGFMEILGTIVELIVEGIITIFEIIGSLFSGF